MKQATSLDYSASIVVAIILTLIKSDSETGMFELEVNQGQVKSG